MGQGKQGVPAPVAAGRVQTEVYVCSGGYSPNEIFVIRNIKITIGAEFFMSLSQKDISIFNILHKYYFSFCDTSKESLQKYNLHLKRWKEVIFY